MARTNSRVLLVIFFLSVSIIPMIEMGHDVLHSFKNPFHSHEIQHKSYLTHSAGDHHGFKQMKFAYQMEDNQSVFNLVWFAYHYSKSFERFSFTSDDNVVLKHNTVIVASPYSVHTSPPTRPPSSI